MGRLIDKDALLNRLEKFVIDKMHNNWMVMDFNADWVDSFIESQDEVVDTVTRCKDCVNYDREMNWCWINSHSLVGGGYNYFAPTEFCSKGKEKK